VKISNIYLTKSTASLKLNCVVYNFSSKIAPSSLSTKIIDVYCTIIFLNLTCFDSLQKNWEFFGAFQKQVKIERPLQHWKIFGNRFLLLTRNKKKNFHATYFLTIFAN